MLSIGMWILIMLVGFGILVSILSVITPYLLITDADDSFLIPSQHVIVLIYGVLLAFVVVLSWQNYATLNQSLKNEATGLLDVWRDSRLFAKEQQQEIEQAIINYVHSVENEEWPQMKNGNPVNYNPVYVNLWDSIKNIVPTSEVQKDFLVALINQMEEVNKSRRTRLSAVDSNIPTILWVFLITVECYIVSITLIFQTPHVLFRSLIAFFQTVFITFSLYLISNFNHPFQGVLEITENKLHVVVDTINDIKRHP